MTQAKEKILAIMTHRLGDIVQTFPALRQIRLARPEAELHFLVDDFCAPLLALNPHVHKVHVLPRTQLLDEVGLQGDGAWNAYGTLRRALEGLQQEKFTTIVNFMSAVSSAMLAQLISQDKAPVLGRCFNPKVSSPNEGRWPKILGQLPASRSYVAPIAGPGQQWLRFLAAMPSARSWQPFHLSELFQRLAAEGLGSRSDLSATNIPVAPGEGAAFAARLGRGMDLARPWLGLQAGASKSVRKAPGDWLRAFGKGYLARTKGTLFLLGSKDEGPQFDLLAASLTEAERLRVVMAVGRTQYVQLAHLLSSFDATVSVDTLTLHLAAAVGCKTVGLYPAVALPFETGPYGAGHRILWVQRKAGACECKEVCAAGSRCWEAISPAVVLAEALEVLGIASAPPIDEPELRRLESGFTSEGYSLRPLDGRPLRAPLDEALNFSARAWALGNPLPFSGLPEAWVAPLGASLMQLSRQLEGGDPSLEALFMRKDPADWFRMQALQCLDGLGRFKKEPLTHLSEGCRAMAQALSPSVLSSPA
jgi:ADP-heptose:LPS heptosyltransferase